MTAVQHNSISGSNLHIPFKSGLDAAKSATPSVGEAYKATDTQILYVCRVINTWDLYCSVAFLPGAVMPEAYRFSDTVIKSSVGSLLINGIPKKNTSELSNTPSLTTSKWNDCWHLADDNTSPNFTLSVETNQTNPGDSSNPGTNGILVSSIYCNDSGDLTGAKIVHYKRNINMIVGYGFIEGTGTNTLTDTVTHGGNFSTAEAPSLSFLGSDTIATEPNDITGYNEATSFGYVVFATDSVTTTSFVLKIVTSSGVWSTGSYYGYKYIIHGSYT